MSKPTVIYISLLAGCVGVVIGLAINASVVQEYKQEKRDAIIARDKVIQKTETIKKDANDTKEKLERIISDLQKQLARSNSYKSNSSTNTIFPEIEEKENRGTKVNGGFFYKNINFHGDRNLLTGGSYDYPTLVLGEMTNSSGKDYWQAWFKINIYDNKNQLIAVDSICISNFMHGQTKSFSGVISCNCSLVSKYKIDFDSGSLLDERD